MAASSIRFSRTRPLATVVGSLMILTGIVLIILGALPDNADSRIWLISAGVYGVLSGVVALIALHILIKIESHSFRVHSQQIDSQEDAAKQTALMTTLVENSMLSDAARSLANRDREVDALRTAIRGDLRQERWDAALKLIDEMSERFGYLEEAEALRTEANETRVDAMRRKLDQASRIVEQHLEQYHWTKARSEIDRLERALPDEPRIAQLRALYNRKFLERKNELRIAWENAVKRDDVDGAIKILRELDTYLTRDEARQLEESARTVFKAKLGQLGMQFQFAVTEKRWRDALEVGLQITEEFPNSRMSQEVAEAIDGLRARAGLGDVDIGTPTNPTPSASS